MYQGIVIVTMKDMMGHSNIATTQLMGRGSEAHT